MSIIIHGMEMPKEGFVALLVRADGTVIPTGQSYRFGGADYYQPYIAVLPDMYKAAQVPPHGRLIDADAFSDKILDIVERQKYDDLYTQGSLSVGDILREVVHELNGTALTGYANAPTVIPAEEGE